MQEVHVLSNLRVYSNVSIYKLEWLNTGLPCLSITVDVFLLSHIHPTHSTEIRLCSHFFIDVALRLSMTKSQRTLIKSFVLHSKLLWRFKREKLLQLFFVIFSSSFRTTLVFSNFSENFLLRKWIATFLRLISFPDLFKNRNESQKWLWFGAESLKYVNIWIGKKSLSSFA